MSDKGIIFSAAMVKALLAGTKTQTRRLATFVEADGDGYHIRGGGGGMLGADEDAVLGSGADYAPYAAGDRLYVRENIRAEELAGGDDGVRYLADGQWQPIENTPEAGDAWTRLNHYGMGGEKPVRKAPGGLVPSIHMSRWASRLWLLVTDVRVQRLQDISEADAIAEGIEPSSLAGRWRDYGLEPELISDETATFADPRASYASLWNTLHTKPGERWADNPWIVAVSFDVHQGNIDRAAA